MKDNRPAQQQVRRLHTFIETVCGLYSRVARRLNISPSFVSRVARGERQSPAVEEALLQEFENVSSQVLEVQPSASLPGS